VAIGHKPNTDIFKDFITLDETGYIVNTPGSSKQMLKVFSYLEMLLIMYRQALLLLEPVVWLL
jgi:thioredoxin reductase (NADPH)